MSDESDLMDDLLAINGVGEATAEKVRTVLDDHHTSASGGYLERAVDAAAEGDDREAAMYLRRWSG